NCGVGCVPRPRERKHAIVRRLLRPPPNAFGLLAAVERAVDLDRGQMLAGVRELARLRQALGVKHPAPGPVDPAADTDPDHGVYSLTQPAASTCIPARRGRAPARDP